MMKTVNRLYALLRKLALSISANPPMSNQTIEQRDAATKHFVIRTFSVCLAGIIMLFAYSIIYVEQPLFNESPVDKAIFGILTLVAGQILQILANYISRSAPISPPISPPMATPCPPIISPKPSPFGNPNDRPPLWNTYTLLLFYWLVWVACTA